jgi:murein L,D-transpeptidase YcbB/YkuD
MKVLIEILGEVLVTNSKKLIVIAIGIFSTSFASAQNNQTTATPVNSPPPGVSTGTATGTQTTSTPANQNNTPSATGTFDTPNSTNNGVSNNLNSNVGNSSSPGTAGVVTGTSSPISNDNILQAQQALSQQGYAVATDGVMGPQTVSALKVFQQQHGLTPSGILDSQTVNLLSNPSNSGVNRAPASVPVPSASPPVVTPGSPQ